MKTNKSRIAKTKAKHTKRASGNTDAAQNANSDAHVTSGTDTAEKDPHKITAVTEATQNVGTPTSTASITPKEAERLVKFEAIIDANCKSLFALGEALQVIRDERLYREFFDTFEEYCRVRWDFSRIWAHYQITAATTRSILLTTVNRDGLPEPTNERQLRPLSKLKSEAKTAAWKRACEIAGQSEVSHIHVEQAVAEIKGEATRTKSKNRRKQKRNEDSTTPSGADRENRDDAEGDPEDVQTGDGQSQSDPMDDGRGGENDDVDEKIVSAASRRIEDFVTGQIKIFSVAERAKVADCLRALAAKICA